MTLHLLATEAAALWNAVPVRLIRNRENAVFEIAGPGGRAALRLHRQGYQNDAAIRSELWWCAALAAQEIAVPAALTNRKGDLLATLSDGCRASVVSWVEGEALGISGKPFDRPLPQLLDQHRALGRLIARVHSATDRLTLPADFTRPSWDINGLVGSSPFWGRFWEHPHATPEQRATLRRARGFLRGSLEEHQRHGGDFGPIHADVLRENILVNDRALSLIDFDDSGTGFRLYDLGTALVHNLAEPAYVDLRDALMEGYGTKDRRMVEIFTLARTCASVGWTMPRLAADDPAHHRQIARACRWADVIMA